LYRTYLLYDVNCFSFFVKIVFRDIVVTFLGKFYILEQQKNGTKKSYLIIIKIQNGSKQ